MDTYGDDGYEVENCECTCHDENAKHEYRLMRGTSIEGLSIREVAYDEQGNIHCWTPPLVPPCGDKKEVSETLKAVIEDFMNMYQALDKPVIDELELEANLEIIE